MVMLLAAALLWGAAAAHAAPVQILPGPAVDLPPPSVLFQKGVAAYDKGDFSEAFQMWLPLAQKGDLAAMRNVALMLRKGEGTARDPKRALWFYEEAGSKGFGLAQVNAAFMHLEGDGVPKNLDAAAFWFHSAALAGSPIAQYNLAVMYERGTGVKKDVARALGWYALAARAGSKPAIDRLGVLVPALEGPKAPERTEKPTIETAPAPPQAALQVPGAPAPTPIVPTPVPTAAAPTPIPPAPIGATIPTTPAPPATPTVPAVSAPTPSMPAPAVPQAAMPAQSTPPETRPAPSAVEEPEGGTEPEMTVPQEGQVAPEPLPPVFQNPEMSEPYKF